jgi:hypothetical protein
MTKVLLNVNTAVNIRAEGQRVVLAIIYGDSRNSLDSQLQSICLTAALEAWTPLENEQRFA